MSDTVSLPLWLFVPLATLAGWAALVLLLAPGVRWFLRRRINRVIAQVGSRLSVELPSFKLTRREVLIDRLFHDPVVQGAASRMSAETGEPTQVVCQRVAR